MQTGHAQSSQTASWQQMSPVRGWGVTPSITQPNISLRRINNAFDHLCCRCCCLCTGATAVRSDEPGRNGRRAKDLNIPCSQVFLLDDAAAASLFVRLSALNRHPHTFITNASQDNPELWDKPRSSASLLHFFAQLHTYRSRGPHFYGNPAL